MSRRAARAMRRAAAAAALLALPLAGGASAEGDASSGRAVGIAPFERVAPEGRAVPDVAERLAARLGASGLARVVGPRALGAEASAKPAPETARSWAKAGGVDALVVGRTTRLGDALSVDARLLAGASGEPLGPPVHEEVSGPEDLGRAVDALAGKLADRLESASGDLPDVAAPREGGAGGSAPEAEAPAGSEGSEAEEREALGSAFESDAPINIRSDELEAFDGAKERRFLFKGNVRAEQGGLTLRSKELEAFYPEGGSRPDRLVASGDVVLQDEGRRAFCDRAVFYRAENRVVCTGNAELEQACDRVRGEEIVFHLDTEVMQVQGSADVRIHPSGAKCGTDASARADGAGPP